MNWDEWIAEHERRGCTVTRNGDTTRVGHSRRCQDMNREDHAQRLLELQAEREPHDRWLWWRAFLAGLVQRPTRLEVAWWFMLAVAGGLVGWAAGA